MFRLATTDDVEAIVDLLANDVLGATREENTATLPPSYHAAMQDILSDDKQELWVMVEEGKVVGTFQLTIIPYLTYKGTSRALLEAVRVHEDFRGRGYGEKLLKWAIERARLRGAGMFQLTSNKQRADAIRFYEKLGFEASHVGLKLFL